MKTIYHIILGLFISTTVLAAGSGTISPLPIKYFTGLNDTPNSYSGSAGYVVQVSPTSSALIFTATSSLGITQDLSGYAKLDATNQPFTGNLNLSSTTAISSEYRITNDGDNYARFTRASTSNQANLYNQVGVIGADGTGGTITHSGPYTIHTFTTTGTSTFTPPAGISGVEVLVVAGGGGGSTLGGGGGGGGVVYHANKTISGATSVYVGAGGTTGALSARAGNGGYSLFSDIVAVGGGGGASQNYVGNGADGGSGGGTMPGTGGASTQTNSGGGTGYGNAGGTGVPAAASSGGGGGGAGSAGSPGLAGPNRGGAGGTGRDFAISGATTTYAGGGGGGAQSGTGGAAGSGGGGAGSGSSANGGNGTNGLGGGGGATGYAGAYGTPGTGGSGVVIVRYIPTSSNYETNLVQSENSSTGGVGGINTFSDNLADTHLTGGTLSFDIGGIMKAIINASGYLGIGTSTPGTHLSVAGTSTLQNVIPAGAYTGNVSPYSLGASTTRWSSLWAENVNIGTSTWSLAQKGTRFSIFNQANAGGNEWMSILSSGNVGIGNTNPSQKVEITGSTDTTALINSSNSASYSRIRTTGNGGNVATTFLSSGSASVGTVFGVTTANSALLTSSGSSLTQMLIGTETNDPVIIGTNNTARITIESGGSTTISSLATAGFVKSTSGGSLYVDSNPLANYVTYDYASSTFLSIEDAGTTYVPYTGAVDDLNLGGNNLVLDAGASLNFGDLTMAYETPSLVLNTTDLDGFATLNFGSLTTQQNFTFPDNSGTFALISGVNASGTSCTITEIIGGIITAATCI